MSKSTGNKNVKDKNKNKKSNINVIKVSFGNGAKLVMVYANCGERHLTTRHMVQDFVQM